MNTDQMISILNYFEILLIEVVHICKMHDCLFFLTIDVIMMLLKEELLINFVQFNAILNFRKKSTFSICSYDEKVPLLIVVTCDGILMLINDVL